MTLGTYPAMSLAEAREAWRVAKASVDRGEDPATEKAVARRREPDTVRSVAEDFVAKYARPRNRTADEVARMFALHLYPKLGARPIETVTRRDILDVLDGIEEKASGARANRVLANVRRMFSWAVERGILEASPVANVRAPGQEKPRDRVLTDDEVTAFVRACEGMGEPFGPLFRLLLLTGQRREEVAALPWAELDLAGAVWHLPAARTKNKRASDVPLSAQAVAILEGLMRRSPLAFPAAFSRDGHTEPRPLSGFGRAKERLDAAMLAELRKAAPEATLPDWRLHDLRRTAASGMARLGVGGACRREAAQPRLGHLRRHRRRLPAARLHGREAGSGAGVGELPRQPDGREAGECGEARRLMEILDIEEVEILLHAESGEIEPLAKYLESGGALGPDLRKWLADHLRGKHPKKRGKKRLWSQVEREMRAAELVREIQHHRGKFIINLRNCFQAGMDIDELFSATRGAISETAAIKLYLEMDPNMNRETLRTLSPEGQGAAKGSAVGEQKAYFRTIGR